MKPLISKQYPASHLMNPARPYIKSAATDIRATFERVRAAQQPAPPVPKKMRRVK